MDNSQTRTIGGTGLGLYLVKQRAEAMGGKVWAESSFGEGSTFYLTVPRLTQEEYERRKQIIANQNAMNPMMQNPNVATTMPATGATVTTPAPASSPEPMAMAASTPVNPSGANVVPPVTPTQPPMQT